MKENITVIGPDAVGKSTVCKFLSMKYNLNYIEFDKFLHDYLIDNGGLIKALSAGYNTNEVLEKDILSQISELLGERNILLDINGKSIKNETVLDVLLKKSIVIPLAYSEDLDKSTEVLFDRESKREYFSKKVSKVRRDYIEFMNIIEKNNMTPLYCVDKCIEDICYEINERMGLMK